jgi:FkbM family methyltransferase
VNILKKIERKYRSLAKQFSSPPEKSFALYELDFKLKKYLKFKKGFFIEAGANDGIQQSNTLYFEKYRNWRGLLIEPIPELAEKCKANRPNCIVENYALVPFDFKGDYIEMKFCNLMSTVKGAFDSQQLEEAHIKRGSEIQQLESYNLKVPTTTLSAILDRHNISNIDLFSLDVEGFELNVLKGLDFNKHRPKWLLIETLEANYKEDIDNFLAPYYKPVAKLSHRDVLYKRKKR